MRRSTPRTPAPTCWCCRREARRTAWSSPRHWPGAYRCWAPRWAELPEALGRTPDGDLPGLLVPPDDPAALAGALSWWLGDDELRARLRRAALARRDTLTDWPVTTTLLAGVLKEVAG